MSAPRAWTRDYAHWVYATASVVAALALVRWTYVDNFIREVLNDNRGDFYPAIVGLEGTILGFVLAALTIVLGYSQAPRFELLRRSRHWASIFRIYIRSVKWTGLALVAAISGLVFDRDDAPNPAISLVVAINAVGAAFWLCRVLYVTEGVVKVVANTKERAAGQ
jgi:hypothetical protein